MPQSHLFYLCPNHYFKYLFLAQFLAFHFLFINSRLLGAETAFTSSMLESSILLPATLSNTWPLVQQFISRSTTVTIDLLVWIAQFNLSSACIQFFPSISFKIPNIFSHQSDMLCPQLLSIMTINHPSPKSIYVNIENNSNKWFEYKKIAQLSGC